MKYPEYTENIYKTGKTLYDLSCEKCGHLIHKKGERVLTASFEGNEVCCSDCDHVLHRRSPGGQSDTWGFEISTKKAKKTQKCLLCKQDIKDWRKCEITIKTIGKWTKKKISYYSTLLKPVCYNCVEALDVRKK